MANDYWSQARQEGRIGGGGLDTRAPRRLGAKPSARNRQNVPFWKKVNYFSPEGPRENVWGPRENVSPGPAVALNGPDRSTAMSTTWRHCRCNGDLQRDARPSERQCWRSGWPGKQFSTMFHYKTSSRSGGLLTAATTTLWWSSSILWSFSQVAEKLKPFVTIFGNTSVFYEGLW